MRIKTVCWLLVWGAVMVFTGISQAAASRYSGKKILFVNSYHQGYPWSDGIYQAIENTLEGTGIWLMQFEMDTKRHPSEESKRSAAEKARVLIGNFKPDVVIASDT